MRAGPSLYLTIDHNRGLCLLRGADATAAVQLFARLGGPAYGEFRAKWSRAARGFVVPIRYAPDVEAWCLWRHRLCVVSERKEQAA